MPKRISPWLILLTSLAVLILASFGQEGEASLPGKPVAVALAAAAPPGEELAASSLAPNPTPTPRFRLPSLGPNPTPTPAGLPMPDSRKACLDCHKEVTPKARYVHQPLKSDDCTVCHAVSHTDKSLKKAVQREINSCYACHAPNKSSSHPVGGGIIDQKTGKPLTCVTCHDPHQSNIRYLLKEDKTKLCAGCHPNLAAKTGVKVAAVPVAPPEPVSGDSRFQGFNEAAAQKKLPKKALATGGTVAQGNQLQVQASGVSAQVVMVQGQSASFWAYDFGKNTYYQLTATLERISAHAYVYVESGKSIASNVLDDLVNQFESKIYSTDTTVFGSEPNLDGDVHLTLLLLDIRDSYYYGYGGSYYAGYFSSVNEYLQKDLDTWFPGQHKSNQREMVYLDINPGQAGSSSFYLTGAHEFQHMIHWNWDQDEEVWINEGLSDLAGFLAGYGNPSSHVRNFLSSPDNQLTSWSGTLADYGAAYLFSLYLWEKYGGNDTIHRLVAEQQNGTAGVDAVLAAKGYSDRFADIFPRWTVANYLGDPSVNGGLGGYANLQLVDSNPDNVTTFARPTLAGTINTYPGGNPSADVSAWAADYVRFNPSASGDLTLNFGAANGTSFVVNAIKSLSSNLAPGSNQVQTMASGGATSGQTTIAGFGSSVPAAVLVVSNGPGSSSSNYNYAASLAAPAPTPAPPPPATVQASFSIQVGWNLIAMPLQPSPALTAESLLQAINAQGGDVIEINRWYAGGWNSHRAGLPVNDFAIEPGKGYFIKSNKVSTWTVNGTTFTAAVPLSLSAGWNLIAVPYASHGYTAESLAQAIAAQGGGATDVNRWYAGGWNSHMVGLPFNDFVIEPNKGYFVKSLRPSTWRP